MTSNVMLSLAYLAGVLATLDRVLGGQAVDPAGRQPAFLSERGSPHAAFGGGKRALVLCRGDRHGEGRNPGKRKAWLLAAVVPELLVLFLFKYFNFFTESVGGLLSCAGLSGSLPVLKLMLPLGFPIIPLSWSVTTRIFIWESWRRKKGSRAAGLILPMRSFFPQIVSGPIEQPKNFLAQIHQGLSYDAGLFAEGLQRIVLGLFKKMVIANRLSAYVDTVFGAPQEYPGLACVMAAFFYSFQIYCDFSGYSDIAIGMGNLPGAKVREKF